MPDPSETAADAVDEASEIDTDVDASAEDSTAEQDAGAEGPSASAVGEKGEMTDAEVREALLKAERGELEEESDEAETEENTDTEAEETEEEESQETTEETEDEAAEEPGKPRKRIGIGKFGAKSQALLAAAEQWVRQHPGAELEDAFTALGLKMGPDKKPDADAAGKETETKETAKRTVATIEAEIATKRKDLRAARVGYDEATEDRLESEILALQREAVRIEVQADVDRGTAATRHQTAVDAAVREVIAAVPEFGDENSPLSKKADALGADLQATSPAFFNNPEWPKRLFALAWLELSPDKPMPALKKGAVPVKKGPAPLLPPKRTGKPTAAITTGPGKASGQEDTFLERALKSEDPAVVRAALLKLERGKI